ncbi:proheparin-binding EGF-like growth factor [Stegostoma tigrinum]|uniref:proheparin-binding EGF-like growth factor n=1 Tax=Stegostoma tigrinum TaxID=3053191 RepID=UPI00202B725D|nr:proheparin-binding EGF-like growth factor [Stegostoma tigrinum]
MKKLPALSQLLLVVVIAVSLRTVGGSAEDQNDLSVPPSTPTSSPAVTFPSDTEQLAHSSREDYEDYEDDDYVDEYDELTSEELEDGVLPVKVQPIVKPKNKTGKKKGPRQFRNKGKRKRSGIKKQNDPCKNEYKDYCIHGKCIFLKELNKTSCVCLPGYQNERCGIKTLYTGTAEERINSLSVILVVAAGMLLLFVVAAVTIVATMRIRRKMQTEHNVLSEEKQKLRTENASVV